MSDYKRLYLNLTDTRVNDVDELENVEEEDDKDEFKR